METEIRVLPVSALTVELRTIKRADGDVERNVVKGRAVVFNDLSQNLGGFREQIAPDAFADCDMSDVVCLKNHDNNIPLGRTPNSLAFDIRSDGLYFEAILPDTQGARDAAEEIRSGNIKGCSFQFTLVPGGSVWSEDPDTGGEIRTVKKIAKLFDVGPVTFPAYLDTAVDTTVAKRALKALKADRRTANAEAEPTVPVVPAETPAVVPAGVPPVETADPPTQAAQERKVPTPRLDTIRRRYRAHA